MLDQEKSIFFVFFLFLSYFFNHTSEPQTPNAQLYLFIIVQLPDREISVLEQILPFLKPKGFVILVAP